MISKSSLRWLLFCVCTLVLLVGCNEPKNAGKGSTPGEAPANTTDSK